MSVHPVRKSIAQIFDDAEAVVHDRGAYLKTRRAQQQKLCRIFPGGNSAHAGNRQPRTRNHFIHPQSDSMLSAMGFTAGPA